jgi:hypothetical protein
MTKQAASSNAITMQALRAAAEARIPAMVVGAPGVGKTASIRAMAKSMGYELITLAGSQMDPTDVTGLPKGEIITHDENDNPIWGTVYLAPWWQVRIIRERKVMLFLDEFSNTSSAVQAAMLIMLQNREFPNGQTMPEETIVLGAMNPTEQAADGWDLSKPTTNRLLFLTWKAPQREWFDGMLDAFGEDVDDEEKHWRRTVVKFLEENPEGGTPEAHGVDLNDPSSLEVLRYAWASRRSWDNLTRVLSKTKRDDHMLQDELAAGMVGRSSAVAFREWQMKNSVVDPRAVLKDPRNAVDWSSIEVSEANIIFKEINELIDQTNWRQVVLLLRVIAEKEQHALVGAYIVQMFKNIVAVARAAGETDDARKAVAEVMPLYKNSKS